MARLRGGRDHQHRHPGRENQREILSFHNVLQMIRTTKRPGVQFNGILMIEGAGRQDGLYGIAGVGLAIVAS